MSLACDTIGSCATRSKNADIGLNPPSCRARVAARSNLNPSTCISVSQYRSESMISRSVRLCPAFSELPVPVVS
jgi:hypothetical protein